MTRPCPCMTTSIIIKITRVISMWTPHWITVSCHGVEGPMTTGYYCAIFPFCGGGKKKDKKTKAFYDWATTGTPVKRRPKNKGILWLGYHRYPSNYKRYERFVSVKWVFLQFSTSSPNNSLPFYGKLLRQSKVTLCPKKLSFKCFEIFPLSELVSTYDKLYIYAKKFRDVGTLNCRSCECRTITRFVWKHHRKRRGD